MPDPRPSIDYLFFPGEAEGRPGEGVLKCFSLIFIGLKRNGDCGGHDEVVGGDGGLGGRITLFFFCVCLQEDEA